MNGKDVNPIKQISPEVFVKKMQTPLVYDGRDMFDKVAMKSAGVEYYGIGR